MLNVAVTKQQGAFRVEIEFNSEDSGVTMLFGRSGAGKSSVIEMIAGLRRPDSGRIELAGNALYDGAKGINLPPRRRRVGLVFQDGRLFPHFSVRSNLLYGYNRVPKAERRLELGPVVELLGIGPLLARRPTLLSGGERQRVAIGRALLASPHLLLMDEPLAALDGARKADLLPFVRRLAREFAIPVVYVTHSVDEVLRLADRLVLLEAGRVIAAGTVEVVMSRPDFAAIATGAGLAAAQPVTVIAARVAAEDAEGTTLAFPGGALIVPRLGLSPGATARVSIAANEVMLALSRPFGLSVRNILPARIVAIGPAGEGLVDIVLDIGVPLRARITAAAARELCLMPGQELFALIKSAALLPAEIG